MEELVKLFLIHVLSPLLLPLLLVALICLIGGVKAEPVIKVLVEVTGAIIVFALGVMEIIVRALYQIWRNMKTGEAPAPLPTRKKSPRSADHGPF